MSITDGIISENGSFFVLRPHVWALGIIISGPFFANVNRQIVGADRLSTRLNAVQLIEKAEVACLFLKSYHNICSHQ